MVLKKPWFNRQLHSFDQTNVQEVCSRRRKEQKLTEVAEFENILRADEEVLGLDIWKEDADKTVLQDVPKIHTWICKDILWLKMKVTHTCRTGVVASIWYIK